MFGIVRRVLVSIFATAFTNHIRLAPQKKELLTTGGYPSLERAPEIRDTHDLRVLFSVGPAGDVVCTGAGDEIDENLKFWRIWEVGASQGNEGDNWWG